MKNTYSLNWNNTRNLLTLINTSFALKIHTSSDVIFEEGEISHIENIEFDEELCLFKNERIDDDEYDKKDEHDVKYLFYYWDKYISSMNKN